MRILEPDTEAAKGWFTGAWDSDLSINVGYANTGVDEPHYHRAVTEIYLACRGNATIRVDGRDMQLVERAVAIIEPGEVHTFVDSTPDYFHFVIHTPGLQGEAAAADKVVVSADS